MENNISAKDILSFALSIGNQISSIFLGLEKILDSVARMGDKLAARRTISNLKDIFVKTARLGVMRADFKVNLLLLLSDIEELSISQDEIKRRLTITRQEVTGIIIPHIENIREHAKELANVNPELGVRIVETFAEMKRLYLSLSLLDAPKSAEDVLELKKAAQEIMIYTKKCVSIAEQIEKEKNKLI